MHKHRLSAERFSEVPGEPSEIYVTTYDDPSYLHGLALSLHAEGYRSIIVELNHMSYEPNTLPHPDWRWEGAMAGPDGFNGRAYIANVAQDPQGRLWVFTRAGRFRVHREEFARKTISSMFLQGLPLTLLPADD